MRMCFCVLLYFTACMLYYCNTVGWAWWDWGLIWWSTILLQCFDTVGWVTWPVKISSPNDLYCVEWDVKPYSTTSSHIFGSECVEFMQIVSILKSFLLKKEPSNLLWNFCEIWHWCQKLPWNFTFLTQNRLSTSDVKWPLDSCKGEWLLGVWSWCLCCLDDSMIVSFITLCRILSHDVEWPLDFRCDFCVVTVSLLPWWCVLSLQLLINSSTWIY